MPPEIGDLILEGFHPIIQIGNRLFSLLYLFEKWVNIYSIPDKVNHVILPV